MGPGDPLGYSHCACLEVSLETSGVVFVSRRAVCGLGGACHGFIVWGYSILVDGDYDREYNMLSIANFPKKRSPVELLLLPFLNIT